VDYKKVGLKVGLEIHQQLDTKEKLFCSCPTVLRDDEPDIVFERRLRAAESEMGEVDAAALLEALKGKKYVYQAYSDTTCLVEMDEEPPHPINPEAVEIALKVALALNAKPVDEIHVMRKIVVDGSNTTGFQRTAIVALGGFVEINGKKMPIQTICLEEEAARKIDEDEEKVVYRLDRLGIPLVEIATGPTITDPKEAEEVALYIGRILRIMGKVKRGIGTIRQDLNISIKGGGKIEVKGVQKLELIPKIISLEVKRQLELLKIMEELKKRGAKPEDVKPQFVDVSHVFANTKCKVISRALKAGGKVYAVILPKFKGILKWELQPNRRFGTELSDRAKVWGGVGGIFHTDEMPAYGVAEEEVEALREAVGAGEEDAVVFVADKEEKCKRALEAVVQRAIEAFYGVPEETRAFNEDGTTRYSRPRPGRERMYPETDIPSFEVSEELLERLKKELPESPREKIEKYVKKYGLSRELAYQVLDSYYVHLFERIVERHEVSPTLVASTLTNTLTKLERYGYNVSAISDEALEKVFALVEQGKVVKEGLENLLMELSKNPSADVEKLAAKLSSASVEEIRRVVLEVVEANVDLIRKKGENSVKPLMGDVMRVLRGRADGSLVYKLLQEAVVKKLEELKGETAG